eukprot:1722067-Amphidinium_carterae.1
MTYSLDPTTMAVPGSTSLVSDKRRNSSIPPEVTVLAVSSVQGLDDSVVAHSSGRAALAGG